MFKRFMFVYILFFGLITFVMPNVSYAAYNFGDFRSSTLVSKAWKALEEGDLEGVLAYTNKCIELYGEPAKKMQAALTDYVKGSNDEIFANWALNDVSTAIYIQGEAYRKAGMKEEAKKSYQSVIDQFKFGQCWDTGGWFWKPADASKEKLANIDSKSNIDFGDYTSQTLATKAWQALEAKDMDAVLTYTNKCLELYEGKAKEMQGSLIDYVTESKEKVFSYWALNDVGTCLFIQGTAYNDAGKKEEAQTAFKRVVDEFSYAQCWDPKGWFWKPSEAAQQKLDELKSS